MRERNDGPGRESDGDQHESELHRLDMINEQGGAGAGENGAEHDLPHVIPVGAADHRDGVFAHRGGFDLEHFRAASGAERGLRVGFGTALRASHREGLSGRDRGSSNERLALSVRVSE